MNQEFFHFAFDIALVVLAVIAGAIWLRSTVVRQRSVESEGLINLRGERIHDLEVQVEELTRQIGILRGELNMLQKMKTLEIVEGVVEGIIPFLHPASEH
jgi:hypothetical protein